MIEQQLINAFMKFTAKAGAGEVIKDLIQRVDSNGNPKAWTDSEMANAISFLHNRTDNFGRPEAIHIIKTLIDKFSIDREMLESENEPMPDTPGVQGLQ
jgi:hypothetical protein